LFQPGDFTDVEKLHSLLRPHAGQDDLSKFLAGKLSAETARLVQGNADPKALSRALAGDFNRILAGPTLYSTERFKDIKLPPLIQQALETNQLPATTFRLNRRLLEEAYPGEIAKSLGGVYPDTEIHTATDDELQQCEHGYTEDAARRFVHDRDHPNEPPQIRPGEDIRLGPNGLSFGGVLVVMGINSFVTKAMFDANPRHEFYVEESYPMDWMYSYLTPFGIIMKVNRTPLPELPEENVERDHRFWSEYSDRLIGNWITYDTTAREVCDFAEKVYLRHDYTGFKGDRKFTRDEDAQKGFSKLRTAIGGSIYEWRAQHSANPAERARMQKEADFAFKQAFAYCPYSEAVFRYAQSLLDARRVEDATLVAKTCLKLDPYNPAMQSMVDQLTRMGKAEAPAGTTTATTGTTTVNSDMVFAEITAALRANQTNHALELLDKMLHLPQANVPLLLRVAEMYAQMGNFTKSEEAMQRSTQLAPSASVTWYNLAQLQAVEGRAADASVSLGKALAANAIERTANAQYANLREYARTNPVFDRIRQTPEFRAIIPEK
jgi:tetratricopeptide (TPR) repeat protein